MQDTWKPTRRHCINCGQVLTGYRNENGLVKIQCTRCGWDKVSKRISRRHERRDSTPPDGEQSEN